MAAVRDRTKRHGGCRALRLAVLVAAVAAVGCATPAELRKLQNRVTDIERGRGGTADGNDRLADVGAEVASLQRSLDEFNGRIEVLERQVEVAVEEARAARREANLPATAVATTPGAATGEPVPGEATAGPGDTASEEVQRYREAYAKRGDAGACIDLFGKFLQTYPTSDYADDATYWLADCYFKQGNYSAAVLRFDDVARQYPSGNKAPDALYRQGEALLRMGHGTAAGNAFEKVLRDYPDSARAPEAKKQLELLGAG